MNAYFRSDRRDLVGILEGLLIWILLYQKRHIEIEGSTVFLHVNRTYSTRVVLTIDTEVKIPVVTAGEMRFTPSLPAAAAIITQNFGDVLLLTIFAVDDVASLARRTPLSGSKDADIPRAFNGTSSVLG
jgi:hypothetical protein